MAPVMVTIRFDGDPVNLFPKWERAVEWWQQEFGDRFEAPVTIVAKGEKGGLSIVNVFPSDEAPELRPKLGWAARRPDEEASSHRRPNSGRRDALGPGSIGELDRMTIFSRSENSFESR